MSKKAMLVYTTFVTRVIVDENATDEEIIEAAAPKLAEQALYELSENIDEITFDEDCPYNPDHD